MTKRTTVLLVLGSGAATLFVLFFAHSRFSNWGFVIFIVGFVLLLSILEPFALNWRGNADAGIASAHSRRDRTGVVLQDLAPVGKVQLGAEIWNARSASGSKIEAGKLFVFVERMG